MRVQAALGSDIALAFDECTPYHADRDYTARSTERTHRWLDRCLAWHEREGPRRRPCSGSSRAASTRTCGGYRPSGSRRRRSTGSRSAAPWAETRPRCTASLAMTTPHLPAEAPVPPAGDRRARRPAGGDRARDRHLRLRGADPAGATRRRARPRARGQVSARPAPRRALRMTRPAGRRLSLPTCEAPYPGVRPLPVAGRGADRVRLARRSTTWPTSSA